MTRINERAESVQWAGNIVHELAQQIRNHGEQVRYTIAVLRDNMLTPDETKARWDAIAECEAQDEQDVQGRS